MDAMALLCTLHADGPATLRLLRESGCTTLETLHQLGDERLAELLDIPPAAARRLLREAEALRVRLGDDLLEREEAPVEFAATRRAPAPAADEGSERTARRGGARLGPRDRDLMQRVLSSWRERDAGDDDADVDVAAEERTARPRGTPPPERGTGVVSERHDWLSRAAMRSPLPPPASLLAADEPGASARLAPGALDGLNEDCCRRLAAAGVRDLEALRRADVLALSRSTGLAFTLLQRLSFLARRGAPGSERRPASAAPVSAAPGPGRSAPAAPVEERFSIADGPPRPEHGTLLGERDYELRPRPPAARTPRTERGPEVPGGPFA